jgi:phage/plasmid primase-like uncharacterized protein
VRFLFYELVSRRVISKSGERPDKIVSAALTDLRESGLVPWDDIVDETREVNDFTGSATVAKDWLGFLSSACIDPWKGHVPFILTESRSLAGVLRAMCSDYRIRIASTNGQVGGFLHTELAPRLREGDCVGYLGDFDLAGNDIEANTRRVLEEIVGPLQWERLALTREQVERYRLPTITKTDKRFKNGGGVHEAVETEALSQTLIIDIVRNWLDDLLAATAAARTSTRTARTCPSAPPDRARHMNSRIQRGSVMISAEFERQIRAAMLARDLAIPDNKQMLADGEWHRCNATNVQRGKGDGTYKIRLHPVPFALFRNWTDGKDVSAWRGEPGRELTDAERQELDRAIAEAHREDERRAVEKAKEAAQEARRQWREARSARRHAYLLKKNIAPHGTRVDADGNLLVPIYSPESEGVDDPVNLQIITKNGTKFFLSGGRVTGCYMGIKGGGSDRVVYVVAEGFATAATIAEAKGYDVVVAFTAGNLESVATYIRRHLDGAENAIRQSGERRRPRWASEGERQQAVEPELWIPAEARVERLLDLTLVIGADDDFRNRDNPGIAKGLAAARAARALIAIPAFGEDRADTDSDFNDMGRKSGLEAVKQAIDAAAEPQVALERLLLADPHSAFGAVMVAELAVWKQRDAAFYERLLAKLKNKGVRAGELHRTVKDAIKRAAVRAAALAKQPQPAEVNVEALTESARDIIDSEDVLADFAPKFGKMYVGEARNAQLLYLICTSRLFPRKSTMHATAKGASSIGKSELLTSVAEFMPPEDIIKFTALSEKALLYDERDFQHKILIMAEAGDEKQQSFQDY